MKHLLTIALLLSLLFVIACGEEEAATETDGDTTEAVEADAETTAPVEAEVTDEEMAVQTAEKLFAAIGEMDRDTVMELCFQDISLVAEELGLSEEDQLAAREQQAAELELFEVFWAELAQEGNALLEWNNFTVTDIAPAEGNPDLIVYMVGVDLVAVSDGNEPETLDHSVVIFNLGDGWFAQWPF